MFNKTINVQSEGTKYVPYEKEITIHEHRAPTDDSVKLLNEMQEKAKENIIKNILIEDNRFNAVMQIHYMPYKNSYEAYIKFTLNGLEHLTNIELPNDFDKYWSKTLFESVSKAVANLLIKNCEGLKNREIYLNRIR